MAKLIVTYENGEIKKELHIGDDLFSYTMEPTDYGKKGDKPAFLKQITDHYGDVDDMIEGAADLLSYGDETDIEEALEILESLEED